MFMQDLPMFMGEDMYVQVISQRMDVQGESSTAIRFNDMTEYMRNYELSRENQQLKDKLSMM